MPIFIFPYQAWGQEKSHQILTEPAHSPSEKILAQIAEYLAQPGDSAITSVFKIVRDHCDQEFECMYELYKSALKEIQLGNRYWQGVPITEEVVRIAEEAGDTRRQAVAIKDLADFHNFLGNPREFNQAYTDLLALYERTGDQESYYKTLFYITERRAKDLGEVNETIDELEDLLATVKELNLERSVRYMLLRLKVIYEYAGPLEKYRETIEALEQIPISDHTQPGFTLLAFHTYAGRADLFFREKKHDQASRLYQKAREAVKPRHYTFHDTWLDIYALHLLSDLEWDRKRLKQAKIYLDSAYTMAVKSKIHDQIITSLQKQVALAEAENRFEDALDYTRQINRQEAISDSLAKGFDTQRYQLETIRTQLVADNEKQALELQLKNSQLRNSIIIAALSLLLVLGLFLGLRKQWKDRRALTVQNQLIHRQTEELKRLDAAKSRFFANVSHELRTPLTLMLGPIQSVLRDDATSEKHKQLMTLADQNGRQLQGLINEILDLRKLEVDSLELQMVPTALHQFFSRHLAQFESLADQQKIKYSFSISLDEEVAAPFDKQKCAQVLNNLLSNAFKFTPKGGKIKAEVFLRENQLHISVTDTGEGIHPDDLPHVFDRYFQTKDPKKAVSGGTGIGLALCKEYARLFGGKLTVESTWKQGSTFVFSFPIVAQPQNGTTGIASPAPVVSQLPDLPAPSAATASGKAQILVVEDNVDLQRYLRLILSDNYAVHIADNGQEALNYLEQAPTCDLILSDIMMPVMDGYQLLQQLKGDDRYRHIPVIMLTARADMRDKLKALRIGVDDYLLKPFDEEELQVRMANLLTHQEARKEISSDDNTEEKPDPSLSEEDKIWLEAFEQYCRENYASDLPNVPSVAAEFAMSESTLLRQVKRLSGLTPLQYLQEIRLDKARQLLENKVYNSIAQVGYEVGFSNTTSFSRAFKKRFGKNPSIFADI